MTINKKRNISVNKDNWMSDIQDAIKDVHYGFVQVHIQDGKVVQIDKMNKLRLR